MIQETETGLREKSLNWFFSKTDTEKHDLKDKYFSGVPIQYSSQWGFHFTFGQIEQMYQSEFKEQSK